MQKFTDYINESSLSRIYQHFNSDREIGTMTAFRGSYTESDNIKRNQELARKVRRAGYGFIWVDGAWVENAGKPDEEHVSEVSLFIVGNSGSTDLRDNLIKWAREYDQDGVLYKPADQTTEVLILDKNGKVDVNLSNVRYDKAAEIYTKLRRGNHAGRSFFLESARERDGFGSKLREHYKNQKTTPESES